MIGLLIAATLAFADPLFSTVTLSDGQTLTGLVTVMPDGSVTVVISGGSVVLLPAGAVRSILPAQSIPTPRAPPPAEPLVVTVPTPVPAPTEPVPTASTPAPTEPVPAAATPAPTEPVPTASTPVPTEPAVPEPAPTASTPTPTEPVVPAATPPPAALPLPGEPSRGTSPKGWPSDPNRVGYFYSPSAFTLGAGRGYVAQKELAITAAAFGVTSFWDIQVGTILPLLFTESRVGIAGTKVAFKVTKGLRVGAGVQAFFVGPEVGGLPFVVVTVGDEDRHLSVNVGGAWVFTEPGFQPVTLVTVSGDYRLGPKTALVTENWFLVSDELPAGVFIVPTGGVRLFGPAFAVDLGAGVIAAGGQVIPLPWVGFTWNWGLPGRDVPALR